MKANLLKNYFPLFLIFGLVVIYSYGCTSNRNEELNATVNNISSLKLNNGEVWQANAETTNGINNMKLILKEWQESNPVEGHTKLNSDLEMEFKLIFKNCTMTGEAHDELHNYLIPLKDLIQQLENPDNTALNTTMVKLEDHLELYFEYFE